MSQISALVHLLLQFRYATCPEIFLMLISLLCAAIHGAALPIMCIVFGQMTDSFVQSGQQLNVTGIYDTIIPHWKDGSAIHVNLQQFRSTYQ